MESYEAYLKESRGERRQHEARAKLARVHTQLAAASEEGATKSSHAKAAAKLAN